MSFYLEKNTTLFKSLTDEKIIILDYNTYDYYRNKELSNFKVIYEQDVNTDFNFIVLDGFINLIPADFFETIFENSGFSIA